MPDHSTQLSPKKSQNEALRFREARLLPAERAAALGALLNFAGPSDAEDLGSELVRMAAAGSSGRASRWASRWGGYLGALWPRTGVERASAIALESLLNAWSKLPLAVREEALDCARERLTARALRASSGQPPLSLARLIHDAADPGLLALAADLMLGADHRAAQAAGEAALRLAARASGEYEELPRRSDWPAAAAARPSTPADRATVAAAVARMASTFETHRQESPVAAAMLLLTPSALAWGGAGPEPSLARWFADRDHPGQAALRSMLRRPGPAIGRRRAWEWLGRDAVAATALDRVGRASAPAEHEAVLERAHLIENPARRWRIGLVAIKARPDPQSPLPDRPTIPSLNPRARRGLPRFAGACKIAPATLESTLEPLLADSDPAVRLAAMRALPAPMVGDYCFDADSRIARSATLRWVHEASSSEWGERAGTLGLLERSPHEEIRAIARAEHAPLDPWNAAFEGSRLTTRRLLRADRAGFIAELRRRLASADHAARHAALAIARVLSLESHLELELLALLSEQAEATPQLAALQASAVAALGRIQSPSAAGAIRLCLDHPIDRIRANAVEALLKQSLRAEPLARTSAERHLSDPHHRVRANAIRGLLASPRDHPEAAAALSAMLADDRPLHRLAGLWAAERLLTGPADPNPAGRRWNQLSTRVADLARAEPEPPVRARAVRCAGALLARMRSGWRDRAVAVGEEAAAV